MKLFCKRKISFVILVLLLVSGSIGHIFSDSIYAKGNEPEKSNYNLVVENNNIQEKGECNNNLFIEIVAQTVVTIIGVLLTIILWKCIQHKNELYREYLNGYLENIFHFFGNKKVYIPLLKDLRKAEDGSDQKATLEQRQYEIDKERVEIQARIRKYEGLLKSIGRYDTKLEEIYELYDFKPCNTEDESGFSQMEKKYTKGEIDYEKINNIYEDRYKKLLEKAGGIKYPWWKDIRSCFFNRN
jgi:hypothetical protein